MNPIDLSKLETGAIGKNVLITANQFIVKGSFTIEDDVEITADIIELGSNAKIEAGTTIKSLNGTLGTFHMGDETFIGFRTQILVPEFSMGDYSQLHNSSLVSGYKSIEIGHNCWIGQNSILNCTEELKIKNNVRIGTQSQLWTHVASGEILEGCTLIGQKPLTLEDNVWLVGGAVISPGLILKRNSIIMTGAVVTKSTEPFHTYAGVPAKDVTDKLNFWKDLNLDKKFEILKEFVSDFGKEDVNRADKVYVLDLDNEADTLLFSNLLEQNDEVLLFVKQIDDLAKITSSNVTVFDLNSKNYRKLSTTLEKTWMKFSIGYRARFIPINE